MEHHNEFEESIILPLEGGQRLEAAIIHLPERSPAILALAIFPTMTLDPDMEPTAEIQIPLEGTNGEQVAQVAHFLSSPAVERYLH